jgi:uncharacterized repeat protein (TIGR03809 family)
MSYFTPKADVEAGRSVVARWRILAQRRLDHLVELYQSGRWKLYHKESDFLAMVQEARAVLKVWQNLAPPDPILDKTVEVAIAQDDLARATTARPALPKPSLLDGIGSQHDLRKF